MRKQILPIITLMLCSKLVFGQLLTAPNIASLNGTEFCTSFDFQSEKPHVCLMSDIPLPLFEGMYVSYTWIVLHGNGSFTWNTHASERAFPVPWEGKYQVKLIIKYFRQGRRTPFAAIRSNIVEFYGVDCSEEKNSEE